MLAPTEAPPALDLWLPTPPSLNHLFRNVPKVGRVKTRAYLDWEAEATYAARWPVLSADPTNTQRWACRIVAHRLPRSRDCDNLSKATLDLICRRTGLRDNYLDHLTIERGDGAAPGIDVAVWLIEDGGR